MNTKIVYKIRRKSDGYFSKGGSNPFFSKIGKIWKQKGHLTSHFNQVDSRSIRNGLHVYSDCEIVAFELVETPIGDPITIDQYLQGIKDRKQEREDKARERWDKHEQQQRYATYQKLKHEFGE